MSFKSNLPEVKKKLAEAEKRTLEAVGVFVVGEAQLRAPVDTGNLKNSYTHRVSEKEHAVDIGTNTEYAVFVEKGTDKMGEQPHLTPAAEGNSKRIAELAAEMMRIE